MALFKMPEVSVGQVVVWYNGNQGDKGTPAMVTKVGDRSLSVSVLLENASGFMCKSGVKHIKDPAVTDHDKNKVGFWEHTKQTKDLEAFTTMVYDVLKAKTK